MSEIKQHGAAKRLPDGTSRTLVSADPADIAEKAGKVMAVIVEVCSGPQEAMIVMQFLLDSLKETQGVKSVVFLEHPPQ